MIRPFDEERGMKTATRNFQYRGPGGEIVSVGAGQEVKDSLVKSHNLETKGLVESSKKKEDKDAD